MMATDKPKGVGEVPKPVTFTYPEGDKIEGEVIKEVGQEIPGMVAGKYYAVIQLIEYPDEKRRVRFGYYRKKPDQDRYRWASQTTYHFPAGFTQELLQKAEKKNILYFQPQAITKNIML